MTIIKPQPTGRTCHIANADGSIVGDKENGAIYWLDAGKIPEQRLSTPYSKGRATVFTEEEGRALVQFGQSLQFGSSGF